jgi:hypothetical protein
MYLIQVCSEFSPPNLNWLPCWQLINKEALLYFKGLSEDGGWAKFAKRSIRLSISERSIKLDHSISMDSTFYLNLLSQLTLPFFFAGP